MYSFSLSSWIVISESLILGTKSTLTQYGGITACVTMLDKQLRRFVFRSTYETQYHQPVFDYCLGRSSELEL